MGQANAARDALYDLRECPMSATSAEGFDISGALMASGDFSKVNFKEAQLSKASIALRPNMPALASRASANCVEPTQVVWTRAGFCS